jgi:hypothetical protein
LARQHSLVALEERGEVFLGEDNLDITLWADIG